jgi:SAM-dependent methyltransferase
MAQIDPVWQERLESIDSAVEGINLPDQRMSQDDEWCEAVFADGTKKRIRFHDYGDIYSVPGFYERLFYGHLKCCSPSRVIGLLEDVMVNDYDEDPASLRVLDVGAGNGMVGDELAARGSKHIVGIDIIPEAKESCQRDREGVYCDYHVTDLTDLPELTEEQLRKDRFNCLVTVAALGFGDIPPKAFLKALDMVSVPGWMAFNIKEDFIAEKDSSGFCKLIRRLAKMEVIQQQAYRRYRHRKGTDGRDLHYVAMVARKLKDIPDDIVEEFDLHESNRKQDKGEDFVSDK